LGAIPLTFYTKYVGECDLSFEELTSANIVGIYKNGKECVMQVLKYADYIELRPMSFFIFNGVIISKKPNVVIDEHITLDKPGVYFYTVDLVASEALTFINIENSSHTVAYEEYAETIKNIHLP
jgi:hypothetical protein